MADIKITGVDRINSGETTSQWDGTKITYNFSQPPSQDWRNEFNKIYRQNQKISNVIGSLQISAAKMTVACTEEVDPDALEQAMNEAVAQTNQHMNSFNKELDNERF
jgi:hypothetical protein